MERHMVCGILHASPTGHLFILHCGSVTLSWIGAEGATRHRDRLALYLPVCIFQRGHASAISGSSKIDVLAHIIFNFILVTTMTSRKEGTP